MTTKNPFPGMNPFIEQQWQDAHTMLIAYIRDAVQDRLPPDLVARAEEQIVGIGAEPDSPGYRPDISVKEPWEASGGGDVAVAEPTRASQATQPIRVLTNDDVERWIEIQDAAGRLVTVIELLSPSNKEDHTGREQYRAKVRTLISAGVNVVEIDLVRRGSSVFTNDIRDLMRRRKLAYGVSVFRASRRGELEFYPISLRDRLPILSIPLRRTEAEIALELQPLIDQCHERGRYHLLRYRTELEPPLSPEDAAWSEEILRQNGLA